MKKVIRHIFYTIFFICLPIFISNSFADLPPDPGTGGPGTGDVPVGGGSPVGGGIFILIALGAAYGTKKITQANFKN